MARARTKRRIAGGVVLLAALGVLGWIFADELWHWWQGDQPSTEISAAAADRVDARLARLRENGESIRLSEQELTSFLRYRAPIWVTNTIGDPVVDLSGDTMIVSGMVPSDRLPQHPALNQIRGMLPDSARVEVVSLVSPLEWGRVSLEIREVELAGLPVPERFYPEVLERLGRTNEPGLATNAIALRLPPGVGFARVEDGWMILSP